MKAALSIDSTWPCSVSEAEEAIFFKLPRIENDFFMAVKADFEEDILHLRDLDQDCSICLREQSDVNYGIL
ncbi:hypothetical protein CDAR_107721 [Caerostris darwini]|uniref:Uncharacterized protein n=1 Tax=Caerostris darwini TaxID=1538125 RepID=A0AAV4NNP0_9ARAC|nr:hypothetical protein CDAR_107721 [Caerostris darwini]